MSSAGPPPPHQTLLPASAQQQPQPQPQPQHHHLHLRTRFRAHRVRESLGKRATKLLCSGFLALLVLVGVVVFVVWLALRPHRPRFHLTSFSASGISQGAGSAPSSLSFSFEVSVRNPNRDIGIYYDALYASVFYRDDRVGTAASPSAGPFFQPPKNTTVVTGSAEGAPSSSAAGMIAMDAAVGSIGFRLELASRIRFQVSSWLDTGRHHLHVSCDVVVGPDGFLADASRDRRCAIYFS